MQTYRSREFWIGIGSGIFLTALLAGFLVNVQTPTVSAQTSGITQSELDKKVAEARQNGLVEGRNEASVSQKNQQAQPASASLPPSSAASKANQVWVYIASGSSLTDIANLLMAAGVCDDGNQLIELANAQKAVIRSGSVALPVKGDLNQILSILTSH